MVLQYTIAPVHITNHLKTENDKNIREKYGR